MFLVVVCNDVSVGCGVSFVKIFVFLVVVKFVVRWGIEWGCLEGVVGKLGEF